jgi:hypothetical protein
LLHAADRMAPSKALIDGIRVEETPKPTKKAA